MTPLETLNAIAIPIVADNVDTDQIFPARFSGEDRADGQFGRYLFHDRRYDENGNPRPDFVFTDRRVSGARIIVAAENYGSGSGRPGAIFAHVDYGIRAIIAVSFGPVFESVAYKSGILTIRVATDVAATLRRQLLADLGAHVIVDLPSQIVIGPDGTRTGFAIDPFVKHVLQEGLSEIALTSRHEAAIEALEARRNVMLPWLAERDR